MENAVSHGRLTKETGKRNECKEEKWETVTALQIAVRDLFVWTYEEWK